MKKTTLFFIFGSVLGVFLTPLSWRVFLDIFGELFKDIGIVYGIILATPVNVAVFGLLGFIIGRFTPDKHRKKKKSKRSTGSLGKNFIVHNDFHLTQKSIINKLIIGANGVWVVLVSDFKGKVTYTGTELTGNGELFKKDYINHVKQMAGIIQDGLTVRVSRDARTFPVLAFSDSSTQVRCPDELVNGVYVIHIKNLEKVVRQPTKVEFSEDTVLAIDKAIRATSQLY